MPAPRSVLVLLCPVAAGMLLAACGGGSSSPAGGGAATVSSRPAPPASAFPAGRGHTLGEILEMASHQAEVRMEPEAKVFYPGRNRYPFAVFDKSSEDGHGPRVNDAEVAIYFGRIPAVKPGARSQPGNRGLAGKAQAEALEAPAVGPFPARIESLATEPAFRSQTTLEDPDVAKVVYASDLNLPGDGEWRPIALVREGGALGAVPPLASIHVGEFHRIPRLGERPPPISTPTAQEVAGDLAKITTREPPDRLSRVDFAEALGKEPIVLLFATPKFCQSRVCAPVVDVAAEAQRQFEDEDQAAFIHMEIYNHNDPADGVRRQVREFHLPTEPWLFAIDREGKVAATIEGAFGRPAIDAAIEKAAGR